MENHSNGPVRPKRRPKRNRSVNGSVRFRRFFRHWRSGQILDAHAYGHKAWPIGASH